MLPPCNSVPTLSPLFSDEPTGRLSWDVSGRRITANICFSMMFLIFRKDNRQEMVYKLTRNQLWGNPPGVRIPPSPPNKNRGLALNLTLLLYSKFFKSRFYPYFVLHLICRIQKSHWNLPFKISCQTGKDLSFPYSTLTTQAFIERLISIAPVFWFDKYKNRLTGGRSFEYFISTNIETF